MTDQRIKRTRTLNDDGEWVPAILYPKFRFLWGECPQCGSKHLTMRGYRGHYALRHVLRLGNR